MKEFIETWFEYSFSVIGIKLRKRLILFPEFQEREGVLTSTRQQLLEGGRPPLIIIESKKGALNSTGSSGSGL